MEKQTVKKTLGLRRSSSCEQITNFAERGEKQPTSDQAAGAARRIEPTTNAATGTTKIRPFIGKKQKPADDDEHFEFREKCLKDSLLKCTDSKTKIRSFIGKKEKPADDDEHFEFREKPLKDYSLKCTDNKIWDETVLPPKDDVYTLLQDMFEKRNFTDVQIVIGGTTFNCHMIVLQCYSEFFQKCGNLKQITLPEDKVTPRAFSLIYDWMLTEKPILRREGILQVFNAANYLLVQQLVNQCWCCFHSETPFREDTPFMMYLKTRPLGVDSLSYDWENRDSLMVDVVSYVRFSLMPPWILAPITARETRQISDFKFFNKLSL